MLTKPRHGVQNSRREMLGTKVAAVDQKALNVMMVRVSWMPGMVWTC